MARNTPELITVTIADGAVHTLSDLLSAIDADIPTKCCQLGIQLDKDAGANGLLIGNPATLTTSIYGRRLLATQAFDMGPVESNLLRTDQTALLLEGGAPLDVHIFMLTR